MPEYSRPGSPAASAPSFHGFELSRPRGSNITSHQRWLGVQRCEVAGLRGWWTMFDGKVCFSMVSMLWDLTTDNREMLHVYKCAIECLMILKQILQGQNWLNWCLWWHSSLYVYVRVMSAWILFHPNGSRCCISCKKGFMQDWTFKPYKSW